MKQQRIELDSFKSRKSSTIQKTQQTFVELAPGLQGCIYHYLLNMTRGLYECMTIESFMPGSERAIRNDNEAWEKVETYIASRSQAQFSHCLCADCFNRQYPAEAG